MKNHTLKVFAILALCILSSPALAVDGKESWDKNCASCHGKDGKGQTKMGQKLSVKDYTDAKVQAALTDDKAIKAVKEGLKEKDKEVMKSYADKLTDEEIKAVIAHLRSFKS